MYAGRLCPHGGPIVVAEPARHAPPGPQPPRPNDLLLDGLAMRFTGRPRGEPSDVARAR